MKWTYSTLIQMEDLFIFVKDNEFIRSIKGGGELNISQLVRIHRS
jgi:hypothetical protein